MKLKGNKPAFVVALFVAVLHALWAIAVAAGAGQNLLNWFYPLHFVSNSYAILPFSIGNALLLIAVAFVTTYIATWFFVWLWKVIKIKN